MHSILSRRFSRLRRGVALLCAVALLATGCATPRRPAVEGRRPQTHIAIVAVPGVPETNFQAFAKSRFGGTLKGAGLGASAGALGGLTMGGQSSSGDGMAAAATLLVTVVAAIVGTGVGAVQGFRHSVPAETAQQIDAQINAILAHAGFSEAIVRALLQQIKQDPDIGQWPMAQSGYAPSYTPLANQGINQVVEVSVPTMGFDSKGGWNAAYVMKAKVRVVDAREGSERYVAEFAYRSAEQPAEKWFENGGQALEKEFEKSTDYLAARMIDDVFVEENYPFEVHRLLPGHFDIQTCWLHPVSPQQEIHNLFSRIYIHPNDPLTYGTIDSLLPTLKWEPLPRPVDPALPNADAIANISNVRYDVRIWEVVNDARGPLVAESTDLPEPVYTPGAALKPHTKYFWSFRAHYRFDGAPLRTGWAILWRYDTGCVPDPIPDIDYFRFMTPVAGSR